MKSFQNLIVLTALVAFTSCKKDPVITIDEPALYEFVRDGQSTVSFSGQTTRIDMAEELIAAAKNNNSSLETMLAMFRNEDVNGGDVDPFSQADLNSSTKSIRSKTAASRDFFSANQTEAARFKTDFELWITAQVEDVFTNWDQLAEPGKAGQVADETSTRYISAQGVEYNQLINKGLIGALMMDQIANNYVSSSVLDESDSRAKNDAGMPEDGESYTFMEHKWDEAYGYIYGNATDKTNPNNSIGTDDNFMNKYIGRVEGDDDFMGIADDIWNAFKLGRAAIVAGDYEVRDRQANIIRENLSRVIAVRAVFYLQQGKTGLSQSTPAYGSAFHDLSEGLGFIYSLRFTRNVDTNDSYFTTSEVDGFLDQLIGTDTGLWEVSPATLDDISNKIAAKFDFTVDQAK